MPMTRMTGQVGQGGRAIAAASLGNNSSQVQEGQKLPGFQPFPASASPAPEATTVSFREQRMVYFRENYDLMTGVRIAGTLGGFFVLVLLMLLYKSKCKKSSALPSPVLSMERISQTLVNSSRNPSGTVDYCSSAQEKMLLDGAPYWDRPELLLTTPIDLPESSSESEDASTNFRLTLDLPKPLVTKRRDKYFPAPPVDPTFIQPIDIHIIQPTPSISPSHSDLLGGANPGQVMAGSTQQYKWNSKFNSPRRSTDSEALSPLIVFLHAENLKYVDDDSSSENLPTRGSDEDVESPSLGSDSVFIFAKDRRRSSMSVYTGLEEDDENCGVGLVQTLLMVHPRDSFSEVESDYLEGRQRRSSSTQTTISDIGRLCSARSRSGGADTPYLNVYHLSPTPSQIARNSSPIQPQPLGNKEAFRLHEGKLSQHTQNPKSSELSLS